MAHDMIGRRLKKGDKVLIECEIFEIHEQGETHTITLQTIGGPAGADHPRIVCHGGLCSLLADNHAHQE